MAIIDVFRRRLQAKVISLIVAILILGFGVLVSLNIQRESNVLIAKNRETSRLLAASIVGSIANGMLEARPDIIHVLIQDYFSGFLEIIRANHGDINETAGDGLMVIFQSDEESKRHALNAARAAIQIQHKLADLNQEFTGVYPPVAIHVGINSGEAFVGATKLDTTGGGRWTFTASDPTTNLAARIAALTKGGEIIVGSETAERIKLHVVLEDTGQHQLKNVSEPVQVFRLVSPGVYSKVTP